MKSRNVKRRNSLASKRMRAKRARRDRLFRLHPEHDCVNYVKPKLKRDELSHLVGCQVEFSGEVIVLYNEQTVDKPILVEHISVGGIYIDHAWIRLHKDDIDKAKLGSQFTRWYFTGEVVKYMSRFITKYGINNVRLVTK